MTNTDKPVSVATVSFYELMGAKDWPLAIDSYQRGFVWDASLNNCCPNTLPT